MTQPSSEIDIKTELVRELRKLKDELLRFRIQYYEMRDEQARMFHVHVTDRAERAEKCVAFLLGINVSGVSNFPYETAAKADACVEEIFHEAGLGTLGGK